MAFVCAACGKSLTTQAGLAAHARAKRHWDCQKCNKAFGSQQGLEQHQKTSSAHANPPAPNSQPSQRPAPLSPAEDLSLRLAAQRLTTSAGTAAPFHAGSHLSYRGNNYAVLAPVEQMALNPGLLSLIHSETRLTLEEYPVSHSHNFHSPPSHNPSAPKHKAIVLTCARAATTNPNCDELVSITALDFFTGSVLMNTLVEPTRRITNWRTQVTNLSAVSMAEAVASRRGLRGGSAAAREKLWEVMDAETVVVGHSVRSDLRVLGVVHTRVIDLAILTAEASEFFEGKRVKRAVGLERLARELAGVKIREGGRRDGLEEVLAKREVMIWCLNQPEELKEWAVENWKPKKERKKQRKGRGTGRARKESSGESWGDGDDDDEVLRWEDVVDYDCWPKSPPDWSD